MLLRSFLIAACFAAVAPAQHVPWRVQPEDRVQHWNVIVDQAAKALKSNRLDDAIKLTDQAMAEARTFGAHDTHLSRSLVLRAEIHLWQKQTAEAEKCFLAAVSACESAVGPTHPELVHPLSSLANFYYYASPHYDRVAALFERILDIVEAAPGHDVRDVIMWSRNLGMIRQETGDFVAAEPCFRHAVALAETSDPRWVTHEYLSAAAFYRAWRKYGDAEALAAHALQLREQAHATAPTDVDAKLDVAVALDELGAIYLDWGKLGLAEAASRRSLELADSFMASDQPDLRPRVRAVAEVLRRERKSPAALPYFRRLIVLTEKNLGPKSTELATVLSDYATALREANDAAAALQIDSRANEVRRLAATP